MPLTVSTSSDPQGPLDFHQKVAAAFWAGALGELAVVIQNATNTWPANHYLADLNQAMPLILALVFAYAKKAALPPPEVRQRRIAGQQRRVKDRQLVANVERRQAKP